MSMAELKAQAAHLTAEEQVELAEFLREQSDPGFAARRARTNELMAEMDAGRKYARKDFELMDRKLTAGGF